MPSLQPFLRTAIGLHLASAFLLATLPLSLAAPAPEADEKQSVLSSVSWIKGPNKAVMKSIAEINVPQSYMFADGKGTRTLLEAMGNLTSGSEVGFLSPTNLSWFIVFRFSEDGYVKDDDKDKLDADKMIKTIKSGTESANEERKQRGYPTMTIIGWEQRPMYDPVTHNLEWAIRGESEGGQVVNYNTRLLGRKGVMEVKLIVDPEKLSATLPLFKELLTGYTYQSGEKYAEFKPGDKLAKYGLAALVTGGAAAVAVKTGLFAYIALFFKKLWKLAVIALVAVGAFVKKLLGGRRSSDTPQ